MKSEQDIKKEVLFDVAKKMIIAARTAPKGRGVDNMVFMIAERNEIEKIGAKLIQMGEKENLQNFIRDAKNVLLCDFIVLLGTKYQPIGLKKCGLCGYKNCEEKTKNLQAPCVFNLNDLGIAMGSAVSIAADNRVDNRIMYTIGLAVQELGFFDSEVKVIFGIPLSATSKSPFFDR